jgi:hypothetical protein
VEVIAAEAAEAEAAAKDATAGRHPSERMGGRAGVWRPVLVAGGRWPGQAACRLFVGGQLGGMLHGRRLCGWSAWRDRAHAAWRSNGNGVTRGVVEFWFVASVVDGGASCKRLG